MNKVIFCFSLILWLKHFIEAWFLHDRIGFIYLELQNRWTDMQIIVFLQYEFIQLLGIKYISKMIQNTLF